MTVETVTLIAATIATIVGVGTFFHYFLMICHWPRAMGRVVGNISQMRSTEGTKYAWFPRVEFLAGDGNTYEITGDMGLNDEWPLGQPVALRYRAANPNHASILKNWLRFLFSAVFLGFAGALWYARASMK